MGRGRPPKGKVVQEGKPTVEQVQQRLEGTLRDDDLLIPRDTFVAAALSGYLARPAGPHPLHMTRQEIDLAINAVYRLAEALEVEHRRRYEL